MPPTPHTPSPAPPHTLRDSTVNRWPLLKVIYGARVAFAVGREEQSRLQIRVNGIKMIESVQSVRAAAKFAFFW